MSGSLLRLSDEARAAIEPHLPKNRPGAGQGDDRRVISGIIRMLTCGGRRRDVAAACGPARTVCNRWNRWSPRGVFRRLPAALAAQTPIDEIG